MIELKYLDYTGSYQVEEREGKTLYYGSVDDLVDVVTFQAESLEELEVAFEESIEDYLDSCFQFKRSPCKPGEHHDD